MPRRRRRNHGHAFRAKVATAAWTGYAPMTELVRRRERSTHRVDQWRAQLVDVTALHARTRAFAVQNALRPLGLRTRTELLCGDWRHSIWRCRAAAPRRCTSARHRAQPVRLYLPCGLTISRPEAAWRLPSRTSGCRRRVSRGGGGPVESPRAQLAIPDDAWASRQNEISVDGPDGWGDKAFVDCHWRTSSLDEAPRTRIPRSRGRAPAGAAG